MTELSFCGYRVDPVNGCVYGKSGLLRKRGRGGYIQVRSQRYSGPAHRLIWEAVNGPIPVGMQINHKNCITDDNRLCNLELVTPSGNTKHAYANGCRSASGTCNGRAKLSEDDVREIRRLHFGEGINSHRLGKAYGVNGKTIRLILCGMTWRNVK